MTCSTPYSLFDTFTDPWNECMYTSHVCVCVCVCVYMHVSVSVCCMNVFTYCYRAFPVWVLACSFTFLLSKPEGLISG